MYELYLHPLYAIWSWGFSSFLKASNKDFDMPICFYYMTAGFVELKINPVKVATYSENSRVAEYETSSPRLQ